jgi:hypothetical protein
VAHEDAERVQRELIERIHLDAGLVKPRSAQSLRGWSEKADESTGKTFMERLGGRG